MSNSSKDQCLEGLDTGGKGQYLMTKILYHSNALRLSLKPEVRIVDKLLSIVLNPTFLKRNGTIENPQVEVIRVLSKMWLTPDQVDLIRDKNTAYLMDYLGLVPLSGDVSRYAYHTTCDFVFSSNDGSELKVPVLNLYTDDFDFVEYVNETFRSILDFDSRGRIKPLDLSSLSLSGSVMLPLYEDNQKGDLTNEPT